MTGDADRGRLDHPDRMALLLAVGWGSLLLGRQSLPPLLPAVVTDLSLSPARAGAVLTATMITYALLQYPAGRASDELSRVTVLVPGLAVACLGFGLLATATTYPALLVGAATVGAGSAGYFTPSRALLSDLFTERRGQVLGFQTTAGMSGSALAGGLAAWALGVAWQAAFVPVVVVLLCVLVLVHLTGREPYVFDRVDLRLRETSVRLVGTAGIRDVVAMRVLVSFVFQALVGFLPTFLRVEKGLSGTTASGLFALVFVVGVVVGPTAGRASDRHSRTGVVLGALVAGVVGVGGLLALSGPPALAASVVVAATGLTALFPVMQAFLLDRFPSGSAGGDLGMVKAVYTGVGALGPTFVGVVAGRASYAAGFAVLGGLLVVGLALTVRLHVDER